MTDWQQLLDDLFVTDPYDGEYGDCIWCDGRYKHTDDCAWVAACKALGYELAEDGRVPLEKHPDGRWWPVKNERTNTL